jgi:hypothetical protein
MGHLTAIPIVSIGFNFYFPMLICLLSIGTYFRLGSRCLHACGFRQFFDDDDLSAEYVEDGKNLMIRGKAKQKVQSLSVFIYFFVLLRTSRSWWS